MQTTTSHLKTARQTDLDGAEVAWQRIRQHLEAEKQRIFQEIRQYPPPIPACDVQFNSLLAERAAILQELGRVEEMLKQRLTDKGMIDLLDEFMHASRYVNGDLASSIQQTLSIARPI